MMYRRKRKKVRKSSRTVKTRISDDEYEEWKARAERLEITMAEYIRQCVRKGRITIYIKDYMDSSALSEIAVAYGNVGDNFNRIAHHLNSNLPWTQTMYSLMNDSLQEMRNITQKLASVTAEIKRIHQTEHNEKIIL